MSQQPPQYPQQPGGSQYPQPQYPQQQYPQQGPPGAPGPYGQPPGYYQPYSAQRPSNGIAIAGMVCGIVALVFCWIPVIDIVSIILGALGVVLGFVGHGRARELGGSGRGMAIAGIVCGIVAIALSLLFWIVLGIAIHNASTLPTFTFTPSST